MRTPWSNAFGDDPRSVAFCIGLAAALGQKVKDEYVPHFWHDEHSTATPFEAWYFDLDPDRNPGDHSAIPGFSREKLAAQLKLASEFRPRSRWLRERTRLLLEEHAYRREHDRS